MSLLVLTGGARSGKSLLAVDLADQLHRRGAEVVFAVFGQSDGDPEMADRIARHKADRPAEFGLVEATDSTEWRDRVAGSDVLVVDCLGTWLSRTMEEAYAALAGSQPAADTDALPDGYAERVARAADELCTWLIARVGDTVVVTNEVGEGVVPAFAAGRLFRDVMGRINRQLVAASDAAYLCTCGRALDLKALPSAIAWPEASRALKGSET